MPSGSVVLDLTGNIDEMTVPLGGYLLNCSIKQHWRSCRDTGANDELAVGTFSKNEDKNEVALATCRHIPCVMCSTAKFQILSE